jgi:hypothetical protein
MRKFIALLARFILAGFILCATLFLVIPKRLYQVNDYALQRAAFGQLGKDLKHNIIIGDSRSLYGLDANELRASNLSIAGSTPVEGFYILKKAMQAQRIDTVYISYGAFHLYMSDTFFERGVYFGFIDDVYLQQVLTVAKENNDRYFLIDSSKNTDFRKLYGLTHSVRMSRELLNFYEFCKFGPLNALVNLWHKDRLAEEGYIKYPSQPFDTIKPVGTVEYMLLRKSQEDFSAVNRIYLDSIYEIILPAKAFFVVMPLPPNSIKPGQSYFDTFYRLIDKFPILQDTVPYPGSYFRDVSHLNETGVHVFSKSIAAKLGKASR